MRTPTALRRLASLLLTLGLALGLLTACDDSPETGDKGYIDGSGTTTRLAVDDREPAGTIEGETLDGAPVSLGDYRGQVVVMNVWGSWCPPCRKEAPLLVEVAEQLAGDPDSGVAFLGINTRDSSTEQAQAFERTYEVPYPSLYDPAGRALLAFGGTIPPSAIPSTVIIDAEGRVAASIIGEATSASTLAGLIEDVRDGVDP